MNSNNEVINQVYEIAPSICESEGIEFVHAEFTSAGSRRILRIYIDKPDGVNINDCVMISRELNDIFDVKLAIQGKYHLEVSSPGINRPLVKLEDFKRFQGEKVHIKLEKPLKENDTRHNYKGIIKDCVENIITIYDADKEEILIPFNKINTARLNPEI